MRSLLPKLALAGFFSFTSILANCQVNNQSIDKIIDFPEKFIANVGARSEKVKQKIISSTLKTLRKVERQELKLRKKISKKDSVAASLVFSDVESKYANLREKVLTGNSGLESGYGYISNFDSISTTLQFLNSRPDLLSNPELFDKIKNANVSLTSLDKSLNGADYVKNYLVNRRNQLRTQLADLGMFKEWQKLNKQTYYYIEQIKEYKSILKDPVKMQNTAFSLLKKLPFFQKFMNEHSQLAALFPVQSANALAQGSPIPGLQSRLDIQNLLERQFGSTNSNLSQLIQQNLGEAQNQLNVLKDKINKVGGQDAEFEEPNFKPNTQKTKSFLKRIELGSDLQNVKGSYFLPSTSELGLSAGFRISDKSIIGVGMSYRIALKGRINNLTISHDGIGLRSFVDWRIKGSWLLSGGYEQNYRTQFENIQQLKSLNQWQQSGLIGISKSLELKSKFIKKTKVQLFWDFLSYQQIPATQPLKFRVGYNF